MRFRLNKWFVLFAVILFIIDAVFVFFSYRSYKENMVYEINREIESASKSFKVSVDSASRNMSEIDN